MSAPGFSHVETWIFDLDNTLYPASCRLFDQIDVRMGEFIANLFQVDKVEARRIQKDFFYKYGTTLRGLMEEHKIEPDAFLDYVHDIDHSPVPSNAQLVENLAALPGRTLASHICLTTSLISSTPTSSQSQNADLMKNSSPDIMSMLAGLRCLKTLRATLKFLTHLA